MKRLPSKYLRWIRNFIMIAGLIPNNGLEKWEDAEIHTKMPKKER